MPLTAMGGKMWGIEATQKKGSENMAITKRKQRPTQLTSSGVAVYLRPPRRVAGPKNCTNTRGEEHLKQFAAYFWPKT